MEQIDWIKEKEEEEELAEWLEDSKKSHHLAIRGWDWRKEYIDGKLEELEKKLKTEKRTFSRLLKKLGGK